MIDTVQHQDEQKARNKRLADKLFIVWLVVLAVTVIGLSGALVGLTLEGDTPQWLLDIVYADRPLQFSGRMLVIGAAGGALMAVCGTFRSLLVGNRSAAWGHAVLAVVNVAVVVPALLTTL